MIRYLGCSMLSLFWLSLCLAYAWSMRVHRTWSIDPWCKRVVSPDWPFAYQKNSSQLVEYAGRVNSNKQDMRHECTTFGVQSKCHLCQNDKYQIQGVDWNALPMNIPTVTDVPFVVSTIPTHRYDYGHPNVSHICVMLSGADCLTPYATSYASCVTRCWGYQSGALTRQQDIGSTSDFWSFPKHVPSAQGQVITVAGTGKAGYLDGPAAEALFSSPRGVAVDSAKNVYVADTNNHRIRKIQTTTQTVSTIAGDGVEGFFDGPSLSARFSYPTGIAVFENAGVIKLYVADTGNHRIREIDLLTQTVTCIAGRCGVGTETATLALSSAPPQAGLADGSPNNSTLNSPMGIAVDATGNVYVADTGNNVIRRVGVNRFTTTVAGNVVPQTEPILGCAPPCVVGVPGSRDGSLTYAQFNHPTDVTLGPTNTIYVADDRRVRRVTFGTSTVQGVSSTDRVVTLAGSGPTTTGETDGISTEASFHVTGVAMSADQRVFTASSISSRIRTLSPASLAVQQLSCSTTALEVISPSGCASYEPPVGSLHQKISPAMDNIFYNAIGRSISSYEGGKNILGRTLQECMGSPPIDPLTTGSSSVTMYDEQGYPISSIRQDVDVGTTITVSCPANCNSPSPQLFGTSKYTDQSQICYAAIHAGLMTPFSGALLTLTLEANTFYQTPSYRLGTSANSITSSTMPSIQAAARLFSLSITPLTQVNVQTISGAPVSLLESSRGFRDGAPPLFAKFQGPTSLDVYGNPTTTNLVYIADSMNHRIRGQTAVCSKVCENGGICTATETCTCTLGWRGDDCTLPICSTACSSKQLCVAPDKCTCIPGYRGFPTCDVPLCVQTCLHGQCSAPDTCKCESGWFDTNCTTPVCLQTCGNGGNCTGSNVCTCSTEWQGDDCRTPVCTQTCENGGTCTAPNTCLCPAGWSGHDCSIPICSQGSFLAHPNGHQYGLFRPFNWDMFVPCQFEAWCEATGGFDCSQRLLTLTSSTFCENIELRPTALSSFSYSTEFQSPTPFMRYSIPTPYGRNQTNLSYPGAPVLTPGLFTTPPYTSVPDRLIALVERRQIIQGVYVCANDGNCSAPDICVCAPGWSGFDCRTPICSQGYYTPSQSTFVSAEPYSSKDVAHPISNGNPTYPQTIETLFWDHFTTRTNPVGNVPFVSQGDAYQGGYACSTRSLTRFEKPQTLDSPAYIWDFPNYYSRYMDDSMYWPPLHAKTPPVWDDTQEGYTRAGIWQHIKPIQWQKGTCLVEFQRVCSVSNPLATTTVDPDTQYRPLIQFSATNSTRVSVFNGCVDYVIRGCFNNGTCIAPDSCNCALGWTGYDCSIPICDQPCVHGACTLPNTCTCDLGWTGKLCTVAICAQECRNGGVCVAPDTCQCTTWPSVWRDGRRNGGLPIFPQADGSPQLTGWTGFDCNTPVCTQAERFVLNAERNSLSFRAMRGDVHKTHCIHLRCPQYDIEVTSNDGTSFQSGCAPGIPFPNPVYTGTSALKQLNWDNYLDVHNDGRQSSSLCGVLAWKQGEFTSRTIRLNHPTASPGEGVYECYNRGSCIQPDVCSCGDGYTGYDCQTPLCRFTTPLGEVTGCQHQGICTDKDTCACIQTQSVLYQKYPAAPRGNTGWAGSSCSMAICVQGFYDAQCHGQDPVGHEGCYRCANGGQCVAPDMCQCAEGWTGYDCREPVCKVEITPELRSQLFTVDEDKVLAFENDPCGTNGGRWGKEVFNGAKIGQGNCTMPQLCTCLCRLRYDYAVCKQTGELCLKPWYDTFHRTIPVGYLFGSKSCTSGFQGLEDENGQFRSCHLQIYEPTGFQRYTASFVALMTIASILFMISFYCIRRSLKRRNLRLKAERRRSRKNSAEQPLNPEYAFGHAQ